MAASSSGVARLRTRRRAGGWKWLAMAAALFVVGSALAAYTANRVAQDDADRSRQAFATTAAEVASTLQLALRHEEDLVLSAQAFAVSQPQLSQSQFLRWTEAIQALQRYPELSSLGVVSVVPAAQLPAVAHRLRADPVLPGASFTLTPAGNRPFYCLGVAGLFRGLQQPPEMGQDFCAGALAPLAAGVRDNGRGLYMPDSVGGAATATALTVLTPVYRGGVTPASLQERRRTFAGFVGLLVSPSLLLERALQGHEETAVSLRFRKGMSDVTFSSGTVRSGATAVTTDLHNGWTQTTSGVAVHESLWGSGTARAVLAGGVLVSLLLAGLIYLLGTGRRRALALVERKTGQIQHMALHDALTGLANRALILDRVEHGLARARRDETGVGLMFLDLDGFKDINDTYGHAAGDQLLRHVAACLSSVLREQDTVGRLGGDEFVVLIDGPSTAESVELVAQRAQAVLAQPVHVTGTGDRSVYARASIGIAVGVRATAGDLLRDADVALYEAKGSGKGCCVLFTPEMQTATQDRLELEMDLRESVAALGSGAAQFFLAYQPTFDLATVSVTGVEALLRWQHPTRGLVMPDEFIAIAEQAGLIVPLGRWVLEQACRQAAHWAVDGRPLAISVNVSPRQFDTGAEFRDTVSGVLAVTGLDPAQLTLEITEGLLMRDPVTSAQRLGALKELGVRLAIDDFGTGYSSLAYLQQFPVNALKIDRSFISGIGASPESTALIHTLIQLGQTLGIETLAEGIEDDDQLQLLQRQQCDAGQGYLFARPLLLEDLETFLSDLPESRAGRPERAAVPGPRATAAEQAGCSAF